MNNLEHIENKLKTVCDELRKSATDSWASKIANETNDQEAAQCLRDDDQYIRVIADRIKAALDDPGTVFAILRDYHNAHYSVFPRDELTQRLCHAFYNQFIEKPKTEGV